MEAESPLSRTETLIGKDSLQKLNKAKIALFGLGGVGSYVLEALARSGVKHFVLVDNDRISPSNINRQLLALHSTVGQFKTEAAKNRLTDIAPDMQLTCLNLFYSAENAAEVEKHLADCSYIVDAIDTVSSKLLLIETARRLHIPIISSMGTGNKLDPSRFETADIFKTRVCPLARVIRTELKKRGIASLKTVFSTEAPCISCKPPASIAFVPASAGLLIASEVIKDITGVTKEKTAPEYRRALGII
ncbi:tRNA threonylcarbamoyladenosine dehydratase [Treponema sp. HNW]|uniref:tRNA threonylcarbamoyladenosine dehydratase n=1 Tax=Treponema sp. HNW TaxID=3116654 RepID=UPI003D0CF9D7